MPHNDPKEAIKMAAAQFPGTLACRHILHVYSSGLGLSSLIISSSPS